MRYYFLAHSLKKKNRLIYICSSDYYDFFFFNYLYYLFAVVRFRVIKLVTTLLKLAPLLHTRAT